MARTMEEIEEEIRKAQKQRRQSAVQGSVNTAGQSQMNSQEIEERIRAEQKKRTQEYSRNRAKYSFGGPTQDIYQGREHLYHAEGTNHFIDPKATDYRAQGNNLLNNQLTQADTDRLSYQKNYDFLSDAVKESLRQYQKYQDLSINPTVDVATRKKAASSAKYINDTYDDYLGEDGFRQFLQYKEEADNAMTVDRWDEKVKVKEDWVDRLTKEQEEYLDILAFHKNAGRRGAAAAISDEHGLRTQDKDAYAKSELVKSGLSEEEIDELVNIRRGAEVKTTRTPEEELAYASDYINSKLTEEQKGYLREYKDYADGRKQPQQGEDPEAIAQTRAVSEAKAKLIESGVTEEEFEKINQYASELYSYYDRLEQQQKAYDSVHTGSAAGDVGGGILNTAKAIAVSPVSGFGALMETVNRAFYPDQAAPVNTNSTFYGLSNRNTDWKNATAQRIAESPAGELGAKAYQVGTSIGESAFNMAIGAGIGKGLGVASLSEKTAQAVNHLVTLPSFGANAYAVTLQEAQERGIDTDDAVATALVAGLAEMATEVWSLDHFWDIAKSQGTKAARNAVIDVLVQAGVEGSEEVASDLINRAADAIINGDESAYNQSVREYISQGMTEEEAKQKATKEAVQGTVESFLGGAASGGIMGSAAQGVKLVTDTQSAKQMFADGDYQSFAEAIDTEERSYTNRNAWETAKEAQALARDYAARVKEGESIRTQEQRKLYNLVMDTAEIESGNRKAEANAAARQRKKAGQRTRQSLEIPEQTYEKTDVPKEYQSQGISESEMFDRMAQAQTAEELTEAYKSGRETADGTARRLADNAYQQYSGKLLTEGKVTQVQLDAAMSRPTKAQAYLEGANGTAQDALDLTDETRIAYNEGVRRRTEELASRTVQNAEDIQGIRIRGVGTQASVTYNQATVSAEDFRAKNFGVQTLVNQALNQNTEAAANGYLAHYPAGVPITSYTKAFQTFYDAGAAGVKGFKETMKANRYMAALVPESTLESIFALGGKELSIKDQTAVKTAIRKGTGTVKDLRTNKTQEVALLPVYEAYAKATGTTIVLKDDMDAHINGSFQKAASEIVFNTGSDKAFSTFFHEAVGEYTQAWNAEGMKEVQEAILSYVVESKGAEYLSRTGRRYQSAYMAKEGTKSFREAMDEYVNDGISGLFTSKEGMRQFAEWLEKKGKDSRTVLERLADWIKNVVDSLKKALTGSRLTGATKTVAEMNIERANKLRTQVLDALSVASQNQKKAVRRTGELTDAQVRYSVEVAEGTTLKERIQDALEHPSEQSHIYIQDTPNSLQKILGIGDLPMLMTSNHIYSVVKTAEEARAEGNFRERVHYHGLGEKTLLEVFDSIREPAMIIKSNADPENLDLAVFTTVTDTKNIPVMVAIHPNGKGYLNALRIETNIILSAYGRENTGNYIEKALEENRILYVEQAKSQEIVQVPGIRSTNKLLSLDFTENLTRFREKVKENRRISFDKNSQAAETGDETQKPAAEKTKFSLDVPVEETKDLIAVHNLSEEKLLKDLELGGFPMPSIAITKAELGHTQFGNISLLFRKETIDPANKKNKVFGADAWTPTFPKVEYEVNEEAVRKAREVLQKIPEGSLPEEYKRRAESFVESLDYNLDRYGGKEGILEYAKREESLKAAYLADQGGTVETRTKEIRTEMSEAEKDQASTILEALGQDNGFSEKLSGKEAYDRYGYRIKQALLAYYQRIGINEETAQQVVSSMTKFQIANEYRKAKKYRENGGVDVKTEVDYAAMKREIEKRTDPDGYEAWLEELFGQIEADAGLPNGKDPFTPSGNRRSFQSTHLPFTLENVVKAMKVQGTRNVAGFNGIKTIRAEATPALTSIRGIKQESSRLQRLDTESYAQLVQKLDDRLMEVLADVRDGSGRTDDLMAFDEIGDIMVLAAQHPTAEQVQKAFEPYAWTVTRLQAQEMAEIMQEVAKMPVDMFEAKPERVVGFEEIAQAVLPDTASQKVKDALTEKGIPYSVYAHEDQKARIEAVNAVEEIRFSIDVAEEEFSRQYDQWNQKNPKRTFRVGTTPEMLQNMGYKVTNITMDASKIIKIKRDHPEMSDLVIKKIPRIVMDPAVIMKSKKYESRLVLFNEIQDTKNHTVVAILEMNPKDRRGLILEEIKVASAYGKDSLQSLVDTSDILYVSRDKKRISSMALTTGLQLPVVSNATGSKISITESAKNATTTSDIRHSLDIDEALFDALDGVDVADEVFLDEAGNERTVNYQKESIKETASILEEGNDLLKGQTVDRRLVRKIASELRKDFASTYDADTFASNLEKVFAYMQTQETVNYQDMLQVMQEVASPVVEASTDTIGLPEDYQAVTDALKTYRIALNKEQKAEVISAFGSYQAFKNAFGNHAHFTEKGQALDSLWGEISEHSLGILDPMESSGNQPLALYDMLEQLKPQKKNPYGGDNSDAAYDLALQIVERYYASAGGKAEAAKLQKVKENIRKQNVAYREKVRKRYNDRLKKARKDIAEHYQERIGRIREEKNQRTKEQLAQLQARQRRSAQAARERKKASEERVRIVREAHALTEMLLRPTDAKHVPEGMKRLTIEFLKGIDLVSHRADPGGAAATSWQAKMAGLQNLLNRTMNNREQDPQLEQIRYVMDPDLPHILNDWLERNKDVPKVSEMGYRDLYELRQILSSWKTAISNTNKTYQNARYQEIQKLGTKSFEELNQIRKAKDRTKLGNTVHQLLDIDMLDAFTYFESMGEAPNSVFEEIRAGWNTRVWHLKETNEYTKALIGKTKLSEWTGTKAKAETFELREGTITLTPAQIMSLYELQKRPQAENHILVGGIKADTIRIKGKEVRQLRAFHVSRQELKRIIDTLTEEQKRIADGLQDYMGSRCAKWGNRVSLQMYGYEKFTEEHYFPIKTDKNTIAASDRTEENASFYAVQNISASKQLAPNAGNPIMVQDIFDVFNEHVTQMATYDAFAMPISDAMRWFNYKEIVSENKKQKKYGTMQEEMDASFGPEWKNYFKNFIKDVNGMSAPGYGNQYGMKLMSNYKGYAIGANLRVVAQQPTAYLRAAAVMAPKYLAAAIPSMAKAKKLAAEVKEHSAAAYWKSLGYYDTSIGMTEKQITTGISTTKEKIRDVSSKAAGLADDLTWGVLYQAVKLEQAAEFKKAGKPVSGKEYQEACIKRFDDVIDHTQVIDSLIHRSQFMRSTDGLSKLSTAFMAEPTKSYNMLYRARMQSRRSRNPKYSARAAMVYVMTGLLTSAVAAVVDAFRDDDEEKEWLEKWLAAFGGNAIDNINPLNMIPLLKEVSAAASAALQGSNYTSSRMDIDGLTSAVTVLIKDVVSIAKGETSKTPYGVFKDNVKAFSMLTGLPAYGALREVQTWWNALIGNQAENLKLTTKQPSVSEKQRQTFGEYLDAVEDGEDAREAMEALMDQGYHRSEILSALRSEYAADYRTADAEEKKSLEEKLSPALETLGEDPKETLVGWVGSSVTYEQLDTAMKEGDGIQEAVAALVEAGKEAESIKEHLRGDYAEDLVYRADHMPSTLGAEQAKVRKALEALGYDQAEVLVKNWTNGYATTSGEKYGRLFDAVESGDDYQGALKEAYTMSGGDTGNILGALTRQFKERLVESRDVTLLDRLLAIYMALGKTKREAERQIARWFMAEG